MLRIPLIHCQAAAADGVWLLYTIKGYDVYNYYKLCCLLSYTDSKLKSGACPAGGLRGLEHPPKVWHNSQLSSCVTTIVTDIKATTSS